MHDAGTVLNPALLHGQEHGSIAHALGGAILEEMRYWPTTASRSPHVHGLPLPDRRPRPRFPLLTDHIGTPSPYTPLGAKGAAEGSSMSVPVALANAVADALGPLGVGSTGLPVHGDVIHALADQKGRP